jgi:cytochrome P460
MKETSALGSALFAVAILGVIIGFTALASEQVDQEATPIFVKEIPPGYRDWKVVSVAHEAGDLNDIRAVLGNDIAIKAYREGKLPFPEGAIIGRIAWSYVSSEENNKTFGRDQSFVAGSPTRLRGGRSAACVCPTPRHSAYRGRGGTLGWPHPRRLSELL